MIYRMRFLSILWFVALGLMGCSSSDARTGLSDDKVKAVVNSAQEDMIFVAGGTFLLGDVGTEKGQPHDPLGSNNKPPVSVSLDGYYISRYETTWGQFLAYLRDSGKASEYDLESGPLGVHVIAIASNTDPLSPNYHLKPARSPNYQEANNYCQWLAKKSGLPFSLPTEAQWEFAARSRGQNVPYATDTGKLDMDPYLRRPAEHVDPSIAPSGNVLIHSSSKTERRPVGSYKPNALGLFDMTGNVSEWTRDWYQADFYSVAPDRNPSGPSQPVDPERPRKVVRDWAGVGDYMGGEGTVFARGGEALRTGVHGFRCVVNTANPVL